MIASFHHSMVTSPLISLLSPGIPLTAVFFPELLGHAAFGNDVAVKFAAGFDCALLGIVVHMDQTEAGRIALHPLEVVTEAPMVVPLHRQIAQAQSLQMLGDIPGAEGILIVAGAVFRNPDGTGQQIMQLLCESGFQIEVKLFNALLEFMISEGYMCMGSERE